MSKRYAAVDLLGISKDQRVITKPEGFLTAPAVFARTGIQKYTRRELGLDGDQNELVRLYRPASEVFAPDAIKSLESQAITINHPPEDVNADNWRDLAVGDAHGLKQDGDVVTGRVVVRDQRAIDAIQSGQRELSVGYSFELDMTPGTSPSGEAYDGVQRKIRGNHHAIVDAGRCGGRCRIGDQNHHQENPMSLRNVRVEDQKFTRIVDNKPTELTLAGFEIEIDISTPAGAKAADAIDRFTRGMKDCMAAHDSVKAEVGVHKERADAAEKRLRELDAMEAEEDPEEAQEGEEDGKGKKAGDRAVATIKRLAAKAKDAVSEKTIEALAADRTLVVADVAALIKDFDSKGKTIQAICVAGLDAALKVESLKPIALAALAGIETKAADAKLARSALAIVAAARKAKAGDRTASRDGEAEVGRALAGTGDGEAKDKDGNPILSGRDHLMHRMFGGRA